MEARDEHPQEASVRWGFDSIARLRDLGVPHDVLRHALRIGDVARQNCTENDPATAPGSDFYSRATRASRERLHQHGFERLREGGLELTYNPESQIAFIVSSGDPFTGTRKSPRTKYPKGPATIARVDDNDPWLFPEEKPLIRKSTCLTFLLLWFPAEDELRCEFSLPEKISDDGDIVAWAERNIIEPIPFDGDPLPESDAPESGPSTPIVETDIPITRKASGA